MIHKIDVANKLFFLLSFLLVSSVVVAIRSSIEDGGSGDHGDGTNKPDTIHLPFFNHHFHNNDDGKSKDQGHDEFKPDFETKNLGNWEVHNPNVGVSAMQLQVMPNNKAVWYDTTTLGPSARKLDPPGNCPVSFEMGVPDCFAHAIAYDIETGDVRTLKIEGDPWCSSGGLGPDGKLIGSGGNRKGIKTVRVLDLCEKCEFKERHNAFGGDRWYASQQILEDGSIIVVGGRNSFGYDLIQPQLNFKPKVFNLPFLQQTTDPPIPNTNGPPVENNLYPFLYLVPNGRIFLFANNRAILFNAYNGKTEREYPVLPGGSRNYPPSGMSALFPMKLDALNPLFVEPEIIVCGGNSPDAFGVVDLKHANEKVFMPALKDCWRMKILDPNAQWVREEDMPSPRTMGDLLHLPTGDLLFLNGAKKGTSGWEDATEPNLTPVVYCPYKPMGNRFKELKPTTVARMYHSSSALLPDGKVLVVGSNPHQFYTFDGPYPTDMRVEKFSPPYLDATLDRQRPTILEDSIKKKLKYGEKFKISFNVAAEYILGLTITDIKVTMIAPPFTTHGFCQNQRMLILALENVVANEVTAVAPAVGRIAPPGYYMLFLVHRGVPSRGVWIHIS